MTSVLGVHKNFVGWHYSSVASAVAECMQTVLEAALVLAVLTAALLPVAALVLAVLTAALLPTASLAAIGLSYSELTAVFSPHLSVHKPDQTASALMSSQVPVLSHSLGQLL